MEFLSQPITLQNIFGVDRKIDSEATPITLQVVMNESTSDILNITKQPVQSGSSITDHAFKEPTTLTMTALLKDNNIINGILSTFSGNALANLYEKLRSLQNSRVPFGVITPKRIYKNMLLASLTQTTDKHTENCLALTMSFQQIILVDIATTRVPRAVLADAGKNGATQATGRKDSIGLTIRKGADPTFQGYHKP